MTAKISYCDSYSRMHALKQVFVLTTYRGCTRVGLLATFYTAAGAFVEVY